MRLPDRLVPIPRSRAEFWGMGLGAAFCAIYGPISTLEPTRAEMVIVAGGIVGTVVTGIIAVISVIEGREEKKQAEKDVRERTARVDYVSTGTGMGA